VAKRDPITAAQLREEVTYHKRTGLFTRNKRRAPSEIGDVCGSKLTHHGYLLIQVLGQRYPAHRLAFLYVTGKWPADMMDHKNGVRTDNRWRNLREADAQLNGENVRKTAVSKKSGLPLGVFRNVNVKGKWGKLYRAEITTKGKAITVLRTDDIAEAHQAYLEAKRRLHKGCTI